MSKLHSTPCRFAYNAKGKLNRKHQCRRSCQWDGADCIDWLNRTPYPGQAQPPVQIEHAPCDQGVRYTDHLVTVADRNGMVKGMEFRNCANAMCVCPTRHLLTCDCLGCVTDRVTADRRQKISA